MLSGPGGSVVVLNGPDGKFVVDTGIAVGFQDASGAFQPLTSGQVDITSGKFVFSASEAYLIENGKITAPVKGATLIGNGPDVLTRVSMVGNDLKLDEGVGTCGKDGQAVPVGVGIPTIKIDRLTVGGTAKKDVGGFMQ